MKRSQQIAKAVAESKKLMSESESVSKSELISWMEQTVQLLYTHQDYPAHLKPNLDDEFAFLPYEIVHDVVKFASTASYEKRDIDYVHHEDLRKLALMDGSWAEFGNEFATTQMSLSTIVDRDLGHWEFEELKAVAPQFYECMRVYVPESYFEILELMGTRFSYVHWKNSTNSAPATRQKINFLKRQLQSKYLRTFKTADDVEFDELNDLFMDFVKKPQFEKLYLNCSSSLPFKVFEEAHEAWLATEHFQLLMQRKEINSRVSNDTIGKLTNRFKTDLQITDLSISHNVVFAHPVHDTAIVKLEVIRYCMYEDEYNVEMVFTIKKPETE